MQSRNLSCIYQIYLQEQLSFSGAMDAISDQFLLLIPDSYFLFSCSSSKTSSKRLSLDKSEEVAPSSYSLEESSSNLLNSLIFRKIIHSSSLVHSNFRSGSSFLCHLSSNWARSRVGNNSWILVRFSIPFSSTNCRTFMSSDCFHFLGFYA